MPTDVERGYDLATNRARSFASAGADMFTLMGLTRDIVTAELTSSLGSPLLVGENAAVSSEDKERMFAAGASLMHGLLPLVAGFSGYQQMTQA